MQQDARIRSLAQKAKRHKERALDSFRKGDESVATNHALKAGRAEGDAQVQKANKAGEQAMSQPIGDPELNKDTQPSKLKNSKNKAKNGPTYSEFLSKIGLEDD